MQIRNTEVPWSVLWYSMSKKVLNVVAFVCYFFFSQQLYQFPILKGTKHVETEVTLDVPQIHTTVSLRDLKNRSPRNIESFHLEKTIQSYH